MPVNEILAPIYLKYKYTTSAAEHNGRLYFETGSVLNPPTLAKPGEYGIQGVGQPIGAAVSAIVDEVVKRSTGTDGKARTTITSIEIWQAAPGVNTFVASNVLPDNPVNGTGGGVAAAYAMYVFGTASRQKFRTTMFEHFNSAPQRTPLTTPPLIDDTSLSWYMLRSQVPFASQDGLRLTTAISLNVGYNRKLARSYGRRIAP